MAPVQERSEEAKAPPLEHLGDFHVLREVGRGGMGVVYEAEQVSLGRRVALKVLTDRLLRDDRQKRRFEREAKSAARLHHTNIVPVFGTGEHAGTPYYVMQFIQGLGLDAVIEELARMGPASPPAGPAPSASRTPQRALSAVTMARSLMTGEFHEVESDSEHATATEDTDATAAWSGPVRTPPPTANESGVRSSENGSATSGVSSGLSLTGRGDATPGRRPRKLT